MNTREPLWIPLAARSLTRRDAVRVAIFGTANLALLGRAAAQTTSTQAPAPTPAVPPAPRVPADFMLDLPGVPVQTIPTGVLAQKGNVRAWPALQGVSIAQVEIPTGTERAPHLHTNTPELAVILSGTARAGFQNDAKEWMEVDLQAGQCVYFPLGWPHWLRNTGPGPLTAYFNYAHELPATVELPPTS
ncbi:cupin domain-containing protein [Deinococcus aquiradiocola]|uniref:Cupin type-1 domain-containing protein n=1 Tax=Deinococcus aquiradiocola TaxID=393059 RepID=A0A917P4Q7_9DEIO|nr:cupin domain-containing protein [Deinococcus aquiradiocola]GGJ61252.1 hypothetical protein GCM10008939_01240 [Deinococcus aquiradiocola]